MLWHPFDSNLQLEHVISAITALSPFHTAAEIRTGKPHKSTSKYDATDTMLCTAVGGLFLLLHNPADVQPGH